MKRQGVLTVNTGSSSIKLSVHGLEGNRLGERLLRADLSRIGGDMDFAASWPGGETHDVPGRIAEAGRKSEKLVAAFAQWASERLDVDLRAVGHRIVHGGGRFAGPVRASDEVVSELQALSPLAPSHQPANLSGVAGISGLWPDMPQSLSFDTAFHRRQPDVAQRYALPRRLTEEGIVRFGFHGLSYAHVADVLPSLVPGHDHGRTVVAHLGSGASLCALLDGKSVATTMGLTALDGLPMATRCGDLDPGVVLHLLGEGGYSLKEVSHLLYKQSGLLGVSGLSGDIRDLLASDAPEAAEAVSLFVYRTVREIGSLVAALHGLETIVFTGGIGENSAVIRRDVCRELDWLGVVIDDAANEEGRTIVSASGSSVQVLVIPADEEAVIARETAEVLSASKA
ncbi:acetate/propionate family kinase [Henriciella sp.]|uniref:acetate/propionate family kinase n=1 Tax=Henriciella sp. TaxID=1968823 RepID=UPI00261B916F|nr:acetate/propionate family kinase [Henriciella sp.]